MRILAMTNLYPNPFQPHRATFNRHQFRLLGKHHAVQVIAPIAWTDEYKARRSGAPPLPPDRRVTNDGLIVDHPRYYFLPRYTRSWYGHYYLRSVRKTFQRAVAEFQPDLIFTPWAYPDGWAAIRLGRSIGRPVPVILQVHGSDVLLLDQVPARRERTVEALREADGIVAVSHDLARHIAGMGVVESRIRVIHDGVDREIFAPGDSEAERKLLNLPLDRKVLLFIGNLVPVKALDVLLNACSQLKRERDFLLVIIGQGPLRPELEKLARQLGIEEHVRFTGVLPQSELPRWYRAANLFILPSHSEGVPNVLLEASSCGTPWVASRVGGIPEIAHLGTSRLVKPNTPVEMAQAISEMLIYQPPEPPTRPRPREQAVLELIAFLESIYQQSSQRVPSRPIV